MRGLQQEVRWLVKVHKGLFANTLVYVHCPACGRNLFEISCSVVEISNDFGMQKTELDALDSWMRIRHTCGSYIVVYWS